MVFAETLGSITGTVWVDTSTDQTLDVDEPGRVGGVTVNLYDTNGALVATASTDVVLPLGGVSGVDFGVNLGTTPAADVNVLDELPASLQFVSAGGIGWTCTAPTYPNAPASASFTCDLDDALAPGATAEPITVLTEIIAQPESGSIINTAGVSTTSTGILEERITDNADDSEIRFAEPPVQIATTVPPTTVSPTSRPRELPWRLPGATPFHSPDSAQCWC